MTTYNDFVGSNPAAGADGADSSGQANGGGGANSGVVQPWANGSDPANSSSAANVDETASSSGSVSQSLANSSDAANSSGADNAWVGGFNSVSATDLITAGSSAGSYQVSDGISLGDALVVSATSARTLADTATAGASQTAGGASSPSLSENPSIVGDGVTASLGIGASGAVADDAATSDTLTAFRSNSFLLTDAVRAGEALVPSVFTSPVLVETALADEGLGNTLASAALVSDSATALGSVAFIARFNAIAAAALTATGDLSTDPARYAAKASLQRLLSWLYRSINRDPQAVLALRPSRGSGGDADSATPANTLKPANTTFEPTDSVRWTISDSGAMTPRLLLIQRSGQDEVSVLLDGATIQNVVDQLTGAGANLEYVTTDPQVLSLSALTLIPGTGDSFQSNGDHIYARTSLLWAWGDPIARWIKQARGDIAEMLRMLVVRQSGGQWSDLWASYFGLKRSPNERDDALNRRTEWEWRRPRSNPKAIELNIKHLLNQDVVVREPWKEMMIVSKSKLSGTDKLPNNQEFCYHRIQLVAEDVYNWGPATVEAEADRPAGSLLMGPATRPLPFLADGIIQSPAIDFGITAEFGQRAYSFNGQIISVNWNLSNSIVRPLFEIDSVDLERFPRLFGKLSLTPQATADLKINPKMVGVAAAATTSSAALSIGIEMRAQLKASATATADGVNTLRLLTATARANATASLLLGSRVPLAANLTTSVNTTASLRTGLPVQLAGALVANPSIRKATLLSVNALSASAAGSASVKGATLGTAGPQAWPTTNRSWLYDPDDSANRSVLTSQYGQGFASLTEVGGSGQTFTQGQEDARPFFSTINGRGFASFDSWSVTMQGNSTTTTHLNDLSAQATYHFVWRTPSALWTNAVEFVGCYTSNQATAPAMVFGVDATGSNRTILAWTRDSNGSNYDTRSASLTWGTSTTYLISFRRNANGTMDIFRDGVKLGITGSAVPAGANASNPFTQLGPYWPDGGYQDGGAGFLGAFMRYGVAQSDATIASMAAVKSSRYS